MNKHPLYYDLNKKRKATTVYTLTLTKTHTELQEELQSMIQFQKIIINDLNLKLKTYEVNFNLLMDENKRYKRANYYLTKQINHKQIK